MTEGTSGGQVSAMILVPRRRLTAVRFGRRPLRAVAGVSVKTEVRGAVAGQEGWAPQRALAVPPLSIATSHA